MYIHVNRRNRYNWRYFVLSQQNICHSSPCPGKNFICQAGFTGKRYRCVCRNGFKGENSDEGTTHQVEFAVFYVSMR